MLTELKVSNFAIIENIHMNFSAGLNVLSGETGSGKSVILKSLALIMGGKASLSAIRSGQNSASIEASFDIQNRHDVIGTKTEVHA